MTKVGPVGPHGGSQILGRYALNRVKVHMLTEQVQDDCNVSVPLFPSRSDLKGIDANRTARVWWFQRSWNFNQPRLALLPCLLTTSTMVNEIFDLLVGNTMPRKLLIQPGV